MPGRIPDGVLRTDVDPARLAGPLAGTRVLVPRADDGADPLVIALTAAGAEPVPVALIQTVPPEDPTDLDDLLLALGSGWYTWLAITSAAAVPVLVDRAEEVGTPLAELVQGTRVAAVGPATARALRAEGVEVDLVPSGASSAATLLAVWPALPSRAVDVPDAHAPDAHAPDAHATEHDPGRVLVPHADLAAPTLTTGLRARGWEVDDVVAYRTVRGPDPDPQVHEDWTAGRVDAVLLTSGSTARNLLDLLGEPPAGTLVCCIGPSTAAEAHRLGLRVDAVAEEQTPAGLVAALVRARAATGSDLAATGAELTAPPTPSRPTDSPSPEVTA
ncbi:uroporphyrinogen-III synthase [Cellulomonas cellasea]|uniref:Uroporphyrinogen-III synthase n=1 Tax=Cellulomonas cellasea TaxID=43670 RepID=A0A7W4UFX3_9CELL|nr:uroporphyrinogen-III synthase [Cellulomonas cellasea]MBB2923466.1 uroporphyrinogen-III synthase [Cellulomonas cellasea]